MNEFLLEEQAFFDEHDFDKGGYVEVGQRTQKVRHIHLHVAKAALKYLTVSEKTLRTIVAPDLAIYRSQLMHEFKIPAAEILRRQNPGVDRITILSDLVAAGGQLANYVEPREHSSIHRTTKERIVMAALSLNNAAQGISQMHGFDLAEAHRARMQEILGDTQLLESTVPQMEARAS